MALRKNSKAKLKAAGITRSIRYALAELDQMAPPEDELTWCIGPPLRASFRTMLGRDDLADRALTLYRERFGDIGIYENSVYPGIPEMLSTLQKSRRRLFVATSKPIVYAMRTRWHPRRQDRASALRPRDFRR
jgi:phosphoglycolate phosphatase